jgi:EAL domain-containing protein (putative c-di-GMP-specific phosphodiesterase class I)
MQIFISWSGVRSRFIGDALRWWLPKVIQSVRPWMSDEDIPAGGRWASEVSNKLSACSVGLICVTPENLEKPWLLFEAGALSKAIDGTFVCPVVFDMLPGDIKGPLDQFQGNVLDQQGLFKILKMLNQAMAGEKLEPMELRDQFDIWWPKMAAKISEIPPRPFDCVPSLEQQLATLIPSLHMLVREHTRNAAGYQSPNIVLAPSVEESKAAYSTNDPIILNVYQPISRAGGRIVMLQAMPGVVDARNAGGHQYKQSIDIANWTQGAILKLIRQMRLDFDGWVASGIDVPMISISLIEHTSIESIISSDLLPFAEKYIGKLSVGISESAIVESNGQVIESLDRLRAAGARVTIEDFGTGYSSLSYLKKIPLDYIKISRAFISKILTDENDMSIVQAIVGLAGALCVSVIADGVDYEPQAETLALIGIDNLQGDWAGYPVICSKVGKLMANSRPFLE